MCSPIGERSIMGAITLAGLGLAAPEIAYGPAAMMRLQITPRDRRRFLLC